MGNSATKASPRQKQAAVDALKIMCEKISMSVAEVALMEGELSTLSERHVVAVGSRILDFCRQQVKETTTELIKAIRKEKVKSLLSAFDSSEKKAMGFHEHLLFLELMKVVLEDSPDGDTPASTSQDSRGHLQIAQPWTKEGSIGKGAFGDVYRAVDKNGLQFAVKEVPNHSIKEQVLKEEAKLLGGLNHTNIVKFYGIGADENHIYMFMELMTCSIKDKMQSSGSPIPEFMAKKHTRDLLQGLIYLHREGIIHRDIKCANVLLDQVLTAKLADMGISKYHNHETISGEASGEFTGTIPWMSPEAISGEQCGKRSDVWAVGCTVYEMMKKEAPFVEGLPPALFVFLLPPKIRALEHHDHVTNENEFDKTLQDFLLRIFVKMEKRPYAEQIANDAWLK